MDNSVQPVCVRESAFGGFQVKVTRRTGFFFASRYPDSSKEGSQPESRRSRDIMIMIT
jgi:hypothetical protein